MIKTRVLLTCAIRYELRNSKEEILHWKEYFLFFIFYTYRNLNMNTQLLEILWKVILKNKTILTPKTQFEHKILTQITFPYDWKHFMHAFKLLNKWWIKFSSSCKNFRMQKTKNRKVEVQIGSDIKTLEFCNIFNNLMM